jgi:hypothetical protein
MGSDYAEIKVLSGLTVTHRLSNADQLNGYQWKGAIRIHCGAMRYYNRFYGWSRWQDGCEGIMPETNVPLLKRNDQWFFFSAESSWVFPATPVESYSPEKIECAKLPPER